MRIYLTHRVTGENKKNLEKKMKKISEALKKTKHEHYCVFLEEVKSENKKKFSKMSGSDFLKYGEKFLNQSNTLLSINFGSKKSEGMLYEIGYAKAKGKKIIIAQKKGIKSYIGGMADKLIEFTNLDDLYKKLSKL